MKIINYLLITFFVFFTSCRDEDQVVNCFPTSAINTTFNLNLPQFQNLNNVGGFVQTSGAAGEGTRGLIIVRTKTNEFKAYDRNAPHICPDENTTLEVKDDFIIICPKDGANWNLLTGEPLNGKSNVAPRVYQVSFQSSTNSILVYN